MAGVVLGPLLAALYAAALLLYLVIISVASGRLALQHSKPRLLPWLPLVFATIHIGSGVGLLAELIGRRSNRASSIAKSDLRSA